MFGLIWKGYLEHFQFDGSILTGESTTPHTEFVCTRDNYSNFMLDVDIKTEGGHYANGGVQFRSSWSTEVNTGLFGHVHPVAGYQVDVGFMGPEISWGGLWDEMRRVRMLAAVNASLVQAYVNVTGWNHIQISAIGSRIDVLLNGISTVHYVESDARISTTGVICFQTESFETYPIKVSYKNLLLRPSFPG